MTSVIDSDGGALDESLNRSIQIYKDIAPWREAQEEHDRRLSSEVKAHRALKEKMKAIDSDFQKTRETMERERKENSIVQFRLDEKQRGSAKSQEALKALADDLVSVRLQNEALRAEMEVQRKAFVVNVNWAARHAELKTKLDNSLADFEKNRNDQSRSMQALDVALREQEEVMAAHKSAVDELEGLRKVLAEQQEKLGIQGGRADEVNAQMAEMQMLKRQIQLEAEKRKKQKEKMKANLTRSLAQGAAGILKAVFTYWHNECNTGKNQKAKKSQNMSAGLRAIANSNMAVLDFCLTAWHKVVGEEKQNKMKESQRMLEEKEGSVGANQMRGRQKALAQLEKQFGNANNALLREVSVKWALVRVERLRKEKGMAMAGRGIANNDTLLVTNVFQAYAKVFEDAKNQRQKKASGNSHAMRMMADGANAMMDFCLTAWAEIKRQAKATKHAKEDGSKKALRMIGNTGNTLKTQIVQEWYHHVRNEKQQKRKVQMVQRNLAGGSAHLSGMCLTAWKEHTQDERNKKKWKMGNMATSQHMIEASSSQLLKQVWGAMLRNFEASKSAALQEAMKGIVPITDAEGLKNAQAQILAITAEMEQLAQNTKEAKKKFTGSEEKLLARIAVLAKADENLGEVKREISDSRKKAREINEELAKVGQLLQSPPSRRTPQPSAERKSLPKIDGVSGRPMSGKSRPPVAASKPAWGE